MTPFALLPLVFLLPLLAALAIAARMGSGMSAEAAEAAESGTAHWATFTAALAFFLLLAADIAALYFGAPGRLDFGDWFASGRIALPIAVLADARALGFATLVQLVGWIVLRFSRTYLHREAGLHRFFFGMCLFMAGMQIIVLAGDAALTFVGWELAGLASWLLIGYDYARPAATENALFAFITNRIGDAGFVLGLALAFHWVGSTDWLLFDDAALGKVSSRMLLFGFVVAAFAKSAQLPLSSWLPRALEGPTPSSAIFYGAIMVHAGIWLLIRCEPVFRTVPDIMIQIALFGLATALWAWFSGLTQSDVKTSLVLATITQLGLMVAEIGLGLFDLAYGHMLLHAAWRAWQFLLAPSYMHRVSGQAWETSPAPAWLVRRPWLYNVSLQRGWLESLMHAVVLRPAKTMGGDVAAFDLRVVTPLLGEPVTVVQKPPNLEDAVRATGVAGRLLAWAGDYLERVEQRLTQLAASAQAAKILQRAGLQLLELEALLERPRYLLLLVAVTFMVIL